MKILSGSPRFDIFSSTFNNCNQLLNLVKKTRKKISSSKQENSVSSAKNPAQTFQRPNSIQLESQPTIQPTIQQQKILLGIRCILQFAAKHNSDPTPNKDRPEQVSVEKFSVLDNSKETFQWIENRLCSLKFHLIKILIFADENWVTFRFMQLDNVLCFSQMPEMDSELLLYTIPIPVWWPSRMIQQKTFPKNSFVGRCKNA